MRKTGPFISATSTVLDIPEPQTGVLLAANLALIYLFHAATRSAAYKQAAIEPKVLKTFREFICARFIGCDADCRYFPVRPRTPIAITSSR